MLRGRVGEGRAAEGAQISLSCALPPSGPLLPGSEEETTAPDQTDFILLNLHRDVYWVVQGRLDEWRSERTIRGGKTYAHTLTAMPSEKHCWTAGHSALSRCSSFVWFSRSVDWFLPADAAQ